MRYTQARISAEDLKKISFFCDVETEKRGVRVTKTMALHEMIDFFLKENKELNVQKIKDVPVSSPFGKRGDHDE